MRIVFTILIALLTGCTSPTIKGEASMIEIDNLKVIPVKINGKKSNLIIDSGASSTHLDTESAKNRDIKLSLGIDNIVGVGGSSNYYNTNSYEFIVLGDTISYISRATDLSAVRRNIKDNRGIDIHGILGGDFFKRHGCIINYKSNKLICNKD